MAVAQTDISINLFSSFKSLDSLYRRFPSNTTCLEWLSKVRWGKYVVCPHCGSIFVYKSKRGVKGRSNGIATRFHYHCDECNNNFTPLYGTIFQSTKLPLRKWFAAIWLTINNKKGISSAMLSRELGITQKTSWYMLQKIRQLVPQEDTKLKGEVQIDCGYIGGLLRWVNTPKTDKRNYLRNKVALLGLASEDRYVVKVIEEGNWNNIQPILDNHITKYNRVYTDLGGEFNRIGETYGCYHYKVHHGISQWKDKKTGASTSKVEAVWAGIRRHHKGIYHKLPKKRAQFYVDEFVYRYNTLKYTPQQRALDFFSRINKTISYKDIDAWNSNE